MAKANKEITMATPQASIWFVVNLANLSRRTILL
jgi:hypothetical protein